jgi:hypothetical protein
MLTRDEILAAEDRPTESVKVSEWGGTVDVRALSAADAQQLFASGRGKGDEPDEAFMVQLVCRSIVGNSGEPLFTLDDIEKLRGKSYVALRRVFARATNLNGFGEDAIKELEGNSGATQDDDSGSPSPVS